MQIIVPHYILTSQAVLVNQAVAFDKIIEKIAPFEELIELYPNAKVSTLRENSLLMPGLINAHVHIEFSANKTDLSYGDFMSWLYSVIENREDLINGCAQECMEKAIDSMLDNGITTFGAISSHAMDLEACANAKQNVVFFNELIGSQATMADALFTDFTARLNASKAVKREGFRPAVAIHSPYSVHPVLIRKALEIVKAEKLPLTAHFMESQAERDWLDRSDGDFKGFFNDETRGDAEQTLNTLMKRADQKKHNVYLDTLISPSYTSAIAQVVQLPGISGMENNMVLFEYFKEKKESLNRIIDNYELVRAAQMDVCILSSSTAQIQCRNGIHLWFQPQDFSNMNLMMLLSFIILGHPEWKKAEIQVFYVSNAGDQEYIQQNLIHKVQESRIPISEKNIETFKLEEGESFRDLVNKHSAEAGMVVVGFTDQQLNEEQQAMFEDYDSLQDVLFVSAYREVEIK